VTVFRFRLRPGEPIFDQVVYTAKKALISGDLRPGHAFPSVRALAAELKIHPNTAHKVIQYLIQERLLEVRPGIGTVVAELPEARKAERRRVLEQEVEQLVVEAKRLGLEVTEVVEAIEVKWAKLERPLEVSQT
jgi:DNA-binding transcriptional regulator YhcF (GntR family)